MKHTLSCSALLCPQTLSLFQGLDRLNPDHISPASQILTQQHNVEPTKRHPLSQKLFHWLPDDEEEGGKKIQSDGLHHPPTIFHVTRAFFLVGDFPMLLGWGRGQKSLFEAVHLVLIRLP